MYSVEERIQYLKEQIEYYRSIGDYKAMGLFAAIANELIFWVQQGEMKNIYDYSGGRMAN